MATFEKAIGPTLENEGGYTEDHAGATNMGITLPTLKEYGAVDFNGADVWRDGQINADDIRMLPKSRVEKIYKSLWWDRFEYYRIEGQDIANKIFDMSILMGARQSHRCVQRALLACGHNLEDDGWFGPITLRDIEDEIGFDGGGSFLCTLRAQYSGFFYGLIMKDPTLYKKYLRGWLARCRG